MWEPRRPVAAEQVNEPEQLWEEQHLPLVNRRVVVDKSAKTEPLRAPIRANPSVRKVPRPPVPPSRISANSVLAVWRVIELSWSVTIKSQPYMLKSRTVKILILSEGVQCTHWEHISWISGSLIFCSFFSYRLFQLICVSSNKSWILALNASNWP